jgi:hypothetical protein
MNYIKMKEKCDNKGDDFTLTLAKNGPPWAGAGLLHDLV